jgi:hypothetical protein
LCVEQLWGRGFMPRVASLAAYGVAIALGLGAPSDNAAAARAFSALRFQKE